MKTYDVTIRATVTKTYRVEAEDADSACEAAREDFSVPKDRVPESYNEEILDVELSK